MPYTQAAALVQAHSIKAPNIILVLPFIGTSFSPASQDSNVREEEPARSYLWMTAVFLIFSQDSDWDKANIFTAFMDLSSTFAHVRVTQSWLNCMCSI